MADEEKLAFSADLNIEKALQGVAMLERRLAQLTQATGKATNAGTGSSVKFKLVEDKHMAQAVREVNNAFGSFEARAGASTKKLDTAWAQMAAGTQRRIQVSTKAIEAMLDAVDKRLDKTTARIHELEKAAAAAAGSQFPAGAAAPLPPIVQPSPRSAAAVFPQVLGAPASGTAARTGHGPTVPFAGPGMPAPVRTGFSPSYPFMHYPIVPPHVGAGAAGGAPPLPPTPPVAPGAPGGAGSSASHIHTAHVATMHVATMHVASSTGSASSGNSGAGGGRTGGPFASIGAMAGGLAGLIGLGGIVGYITGAVRETADEYVREANMSTRLGGRRGAEGLADPLYAAGRPLGFVRSEALDFAEAFKSGRGTTRSGGTNLADVGAGLRFTRAFGMEAGDVGGRFERMENAGIFHGGDLKRFSSELAASINQGQMLPRAAEAMEAAAMVLGEVSGRIGDLNDGQRRSIMGFQTLLNTSKDEMFRGQKGAQLIAGMHGAFQPGQGSDVQNTLINAALLRRNPNMTAWQLMKRREEGATIENLTDVGGFARQLAGPGASRDTINTLMKQVFPSLGFTQIDKLFDVTKGFTNFGDKKAIAAAAGEGVLGAGLDKQQQARDGAVESIRSVQVQADDFRKTIGGTFLPAFKLVQDKMLGFGNWLANTGRPMFEGAWKSITGFMNEAGKTGFGGVFKMLSDGLGSIFADLKKQVQNLFTTDLFGNMFGAKADEEKAKGNNVAATFWKGLSDALMTDKGRADRTATTLLQGLNSGAFKGGQAYRGLEKEGFVVSPSSAHAEQDPVSFGRVMGQTKVHGHHDGDPGKRDYGANAGVLPGTLLTTGQNKMAFRGKFDDPKGGGLFSRFERLDKDGKPTGIMTDYMHLSYAEQFEQGQVVDPGTVIGASQMYITDQGGITTGQHLHGQSYRYTKDGRIPFDPREDIGITHKYLTHKGLLMLNPRAVPKRFGGTGEERVYSSKGGKRAMVPGENPANVLIDRESGGGMKPVGHPTGAHGYEEPPTPAKAPVLPVPGGKPKPKPPSMKGAGGSASFNVEGAMPYDVSILTNNGGNVVSGGARPHFAAAAGQIKIEQHFHLDGRSGDDELFGLVRRATADGMVEAEARLAGMMTAG